MSQTVTKTKTKTATDADNTINKIHIVSFLLFNASIQILVSTILGFIMLIPMQPWGEFTKPYLPSMHAFLAVHLDWYMLAFLEFCMAFIYNTYPCLECKTSTLLLIFGGWINPMAYLLRSYGINAFVLGGDWLKLISASISLISAICILICWSLLIYRFYVRIICVEYVQNINMNMNMKIQ